MLSPISREAFNASLEARRQIITGYMAFIAALSVAILAVGNDRFPWTWIFSLIVLSLPSLVALLSLDSRRGIAPGTAARAWLGVAYILGFVPSILGIDLLAWHFSAVAGVTFVVLCVSWGVILVRVVPST